MRRARCRPIALALALACLPLGARASCPADWTSQQCQSTSSSVGHVVASAAFDFRTPPWIDDGELQCAVDCLDGMPDADWSETERPSAVRPIPHGVVLELDPRAKYVLQGGVHLPLAVDGPLLILGGGAQLELPFLPGSAELATPGFSFLSRRSPAFEGDVAELAVLRRFGQGWRIEGLRMRGRCVAARTTVRMERSCRDAAGAPEWRYVGVDVAGTVGLIVERCTFERFDHAVAVRSSSLPRISSTALHDSRAESVAFLDGTSTATLRKVLTRGGEDALIQGPSAVLEQFEFLTFPCDGAHVRIAPAGQRPSRVVLRDTHFENEAPEALVRMEAAGQLRIEGLEITIPPATTPCGPVALADRVVLDVAPPAGRRCDAVVERTSSMATSRRFTGTSDACVTFRDVQNLYVAQDMTLDGGGWDWWLGTAPASVHHDQYGFRDLRASRQPQKARAGCLWMDVASSRLRVFDGARWLTVELEP